jgi:hypothetical protein
MAGKKGFGTVLSYSTDGVLGTGTTFVTLANVTKIKPFAAKADVIDVSAMDSPSNTREKISGMLDAGLLQFDLNYDDKNAGHKFLLTNLGVTITWKVTGPGASPASIVFAGFVKDLGPDYPFDNKLSASPVIEITGVLTAA